MTSAALVLPGSSNRPPDERAALLAGCGVRAIAVPLFDGMLEEVPLERFDAVLDDLAATSDRLVVIGTSKGAEAALLLGAYDQRITGVAAFAPSSVVWAGLGGRQRSSWTRNGEPLAFARYDEAWAPTGDPPAYLGLYERSLAAASSAARIPVDRIDGDVLLVAGGDDQVWPSVAMAMAIAERCPATVVSHPTAGHRARLPGEPAPVAGQQMARGGDPDADAELGALAWPHLLRMLGIDG